MKQKLSMSFLVLILALMGCEKMNSTVEKTASTAGVKKATSTQVDADIKIGIVNIQQVILNVAEGKKARSDLEKEIRGQQTDMQKEKKALERMDKELKERMALLSNEAKQKKFADFQKKLVALQKKEMEFAGNIKEREQQATQKIAAKVSVLVNKIAEEKNLHAVFEGSSSGLMFVKDPINLTEEVISMYDNFKVSRVEDQASKTEPAAVDADTTLEKSDSEKK